MNSTICIGAVLVVAVVAALVVILWIKNNPDYLANGNSYGDDYDE